MRSPRVSFAIVATLALALGGGAADAAKRPRMTRARAAATGSQILSGQALQPGATLTAPGGAYTLTMRPDGDAVLAGPAGRLFDTGTSGHPGAALVQEPGGDLVVTGPEGEPLWISWSVNHPGATTRLGDDDRLVVSDPGGAQLWASPAPPAPPAPTATTTGTTASTTTTGAPCSSTPGPGDSVSRWRPVVSCVLGMLGQPQTDALIGDVLLVIQHESSGVPTAINNWDSNAQRGDPSRGLMQTIGATFAANRSPLLANDIYDPAADIYAGLHYAIARYGSIQAIPGVVRLNAGQSYVGYRRDALRKRGSASAGGV